MTRTMEITIDGKRYRFYLSAWKTRSGFAHGAEMFDCESYRIVAEDKCYYLNRTWECWTYQTAILYAVRKAMDYLKSDVADNLRAENGWKNITKKRRAVLEEALDNNAEMVRLRKLYEELNKSRPAWDYFS